MPPHPKPTPKPKKPGAMRSRPKNAPMSSNRAQERAEKALDTARATKAPRAPKTPPSAKPAAPAGGTKTDMLVAMLSTSGGATSKEMEAATGWAPHSVRGLLGTLRKRGVRVTSTKLPKEPTIYRIVVAKPAPAEAVGDVL